MSDTLNISNSQETNNVLSTKIEKTYETEIEKPEEPKNTITNEKASEDDLNYNSDEYLPITQEAIENSFQEDEEWFTDMMLQSLNDYSSNTKLGLSAGNYIVGFLSSAGSNFMTQAERELGIIQVKSDMQSLNYQFDSLKTCFTTIPALKDDPIENAESLLNTADSIIENIDRLSDYAEDILDHVGDTVENIEKSIENLNNTISNLESLIITNPLEKFPSLISDKFINLDIVQDSFKLVETAKQSATNVIVTVKAIRTPKNLKDAKTVISQLRSIVDEARKVKSDAQKVYNAYSNISSMIKSGNYVQLAFSLMSTAAFTQRPPAYNAKYPLNFAYKTEGGHTFEVDNTPKSERLSVTHKAGTSLEIQPDGGTVVSCKTDMQMSIKGNQEIHANNATIVLDNNCRILSKGTNIEVEGTANIAATTANITTSGNATLNSAGACTVMAGTTCSVTSKECTSLCSTGKVSIVGVEGVDIISDGGDVNISGGMGVKFNFGGIYYANCWGGYWFKTDASELHENNSSGFLSSGTCRIKGSLISLN